MTTDNCPAVAGSSPPINNKIAANNNSSINRKNHDLLTRWQGVALLTADCMGVGILALPADMKSLGWLVGISFLVANCPINYYAGNLLSMLALDLEKDQSLSSSPDNGDSKALTATSAASEAMTRDGEIATTTEHIELATIEATATMATATGKTTRRRFSNKKRQSYKGLPQSQNHHHHRPRDGDCDDSGDEDFVDEQIIGIPDDDSLGEGAFEDELSTIDATSPSYDTVAVDSASDGGCDKATCDLITITAAVDRAYVALVGALYYANLFLVLGDYMLVMGKSVSAMLRGSVCLPTAGAVATVLMFGLCQFRTMANLGRTVSLLSLLSLSIVIAQCLFHHRTRESGGSSDRYIADALIAEDYNKEDGDYYSKDVAATTSNANDIWNKFSALAGIGFAVGSQKLFLNIRHELQYREEASNVLAGSLTVYGSAYVAVVLLAGPDPPSFLFDSIPDGWGRQLAGLLLWFHVAVSYAINSQALCASIDGSLKGRAIIPSFVEENPAARWFVITLAVSISSYLVSNAVPFFKDLVALIGALTSVPLCLTLPAVLHRRAKQNRGSSSLSLLLPDFRSWSNSYSLLLYSFLFLCIGLIGAIVDIDEDWLNHGKPFSCQ